MRMQRRNEDQSTFVKPFHPQHVRRVMPSHGKEAEMMSRKLTAVAFIAAGTMALASCGAPVEQTADSPSGTGSSSGTCVDTSGSSIKIGFVNSLSGTMAI